MVFYIQKSQKLSSFINEANIKPMNKIVYTTNFSNEDNYILDGFFVGWPNPPSKDRFRAILLNSAHIVLAIDQEKNKLIGFITAISDGVLSSYIPLLEVLPEYQSRGIGKKLVEHILLELKDLYMIDLSCDEDLMPFYERFGMIRGQSMFLRNYDSLKKS